MKIPPVPSDEGRSSSVRTATGLATSIQRECEREARSARRLKKN